MARPAEGQTINWGNAASGSTINYDSDGNALDDATYTYSFGVFLGGWDPAANDPADWWSNWVTLDTTTYDDSTSFFSGSWTVTDNTFEGERAYIWIYNHISPIDETTEWVLITDNDGLDGDDWIIPTFDDQKALTLEFRVQNATEVVYGGLNSSQGPGEFTADPKPFELQTHTFPPPIPEPGSCALLGCGAAFCLCLRRQRRGGNREGSRAVVSNSEQL